MLATCIIVWLALGWLLIETEGLTVRLPSGKVKVHDGKARTMAQWAEHDKVFAKEIGKEQKTYAERRAHILAHTCPICDKGDDSLIVETKTLTYGNSTCHVRGCPECIEIYRLEIEKSQTGKTRAASYPIFQPPLFIEQVQIGSHNKYVKWNSETNEEEILPKYKKGYHHRIVQDYTTRYRDCLPGTEWLKAHENDYRDFEPTIDISIDGKAISVNGNYKQGMIAGFMGQYTERVRAGKKVLTVLKGGHIENMGGGCYVAINGELKDGEYKYF